MRERDIASRIRRYLKGLGPRCWFWKTSDRSTVGIPDFVGWLDGRPFGLEVKGPRGRASAIQAYNLRRMRTAGGTTGVVRSVDDVRRLLEREEDEDAG